MHRYPDRTDAVDAEPGWGTIDMPSIKSLEHPLREELILRFHEHPIEPLEIPERASHLAVHMGELCATADRAHVARLCRHYDVPQPNDGALHFRADFGAFRLVWQRHIEFCTYTFYRSEGFETPFDAPIFELVPNDWLADIPGDVLAATHLAIRPRGAPLSPQQLSRVFAGNSYVGSQLDGGAARLYSDFRIHDDRFTRILIEDEALSEKQAGRLVQRLFNIYTYRLLALLALPVAREVGPRLRELDQNLSRLASEMSDPQSVYSDAEVLGKLTKLASEAEKIAATTTNRFGATVAYHDMVRGWLDGLRETPIDGLQTLSEFLNKRLDPAVRTCANTMQRQEALSERASRISGLLRTRVEVELEAQNRDLLNSMNHRAQLQLRLQETVEGLSVAAISYYMVSLVGYLLKGIKAAEIVSFDVDIGKAVAVPLVALLLWLGLKRMHRKLHEDLHSGPRENAPGPTPAEVPSQMPVPAANRPGEAAQPAE